MNAAQLIGQFVVKEAASGKDVVLESLWRDQRCVVMFFRRFACPYCRLDAVRLSKLKPQLDQANVRLVGIGHEKAGLEDFQKQEFFKGELYIDVEKNAYKALQFKRYGPHCTPCSEGPSGKGCLCRFNYFNIFPAILTSTARAKAAEVSGKLPRYARRVTHEVKALEMLHRAKTFYISMYIFFFF
ncbi:unnamed protein product [Ixodes persulcatus]